MKFSTQRLKPTFSHWVFDLDGTILNSGKAFERALHQILTDIGIPPQPELIARAYHHFNPDEYFLSITQDQKKVDYGVQQLMNFNMTQAHQIPIYEGIIEILQYLKDNDLVLSAWTGRDKASAVKVLETHDLLKYFEVCVGRTCVPKNKPHPDGLQKIITDFNHHHEDMVMVGDHLYDMQGARSARVPCVSVSWSGHGHPQAKEISDFHFDCIQEFKGWIQCGYGQ